MKTAIDDLKKGIENLGKEEKRLGACVVNQEGEVIRIKSERAKVLIQIKDYEDALLILNLARGLEKKTEEEKI